MKLPHHEFINTRQAKMMKSVMTTRYFAAVMLLFSCLLFGQSQVHAADNVWTLKIQGAITPASADFFISTLRKAEKENIQLLILQLDTPGGLDPSMRDMIKAILSAEVPIATYVYPSGSRAASAGTYILYASHIAAMAPATNLGSSTPVKMQPGSITPDFEKDKDNSPSSMDKKMVNDAVAYIRGLAELRGRNVEWAEETVREAANLSAREALEKGVIDIVAEDLHKLLQSLNSYQVMLESGRISLQLDNPVLTEIEAGWRYELLNLITNPNIAYILLMIGIYGLILEFYNPGMGISGVIGVICLLLAAFALHMLPINYAGLALLIVGIGLMMGEAFSPSFGVLGIGGLVAFVFGSVMLMDSDLPAYQISMPLIAALAATSAAICVFVVGAALRARQTKVVSGQEAIIGAEAEAREDFTGYGKVYAMGEQWQAFSSVPITKGEVLRIVARDGLVLHVETIQEQ